MTTVYPELERMAAVRDQSQLIGEFLDSLHDMGYALCCVPEGNSELYWPTHKSIEQVLAQYFEIDLDKVEKERVALLKEFQEKAAST